MSHKSGKHSSGGSSSRSGSKEHFDYALQKYTSSRDGPPAEKLMQHSSGSKHSFSKRDAFGYKKDAKRQLSEWDKRWAEASRSSYGD